MQVHANGVLGHLHFGAPLAADRSHAYLTRPPFTGFANRVGDPIPLEYPTTGSGDYRIPALTRRAGRRLDRPRAGLSPPSDRRRQAGPGKRRPTARHLRRSRHRGRHARGHARRCAERAARRPDLHDVRRPAGRRPQRGGPERRQRHRPSHERDERDARPARCALGARPAERSVGPRDPRHHEPVAPGTPVGRQRSRHVERQPQPVPRAPPPDDDRGGRRGLRPEPRLLGQLHRRGRGRLVRHHPRPDRDQPEHVHLDARAGRRLRDPRGDPRLLRRRARRDERRAPRPLSRATGARDLARCPSAGAAQQLGGDLPRLR